MTKETIPSTNGQNFTGFASRPEALGIPSNSQRICDSMMRVCRLLDEPDLPGAFRGAASAHAVLYLQAVVFHVAHT
ncbi:hypothetical protein [Caballeronia sp. AZ10_KS36]|uniref:hypothetical protein n=1 Tax=Caballeronia sp. AZ10_KS36 TaxID=2921757 RepID=UPI002028FF14|nr:hypothetical protein [Caballeronia sp. AZ10_KS36]